MPKKPDKKSDKKPAKPVKKTAKASSKSTAKQTAKAAPKVSKPSKPESKQPAAKRRSVNIKRPNLKLNMSASTRRALTAMFAVTGIIILGVAVWGWYTVVYSNPERTFWAMVDKSLQTPGVTRTVTQKVQGIDRYENAQFNLGEQITVHSKVNLKQPSPQGDSEVTTEVIGTNDYDYSRYLKIISPYKNAQGQAPKFDNIIGIWAKSDPVKPGEQTTAHFAKESTLQPVLFGNFNGKQRADLMKQLRGMNAYGIDFKRALTSTHNGRKQITYHVNVKPDVFIAVLHSYAEKLNMGGLQNLSLSSCLQQSLNADITVDVLTRQLVTVKYPDIDCTEQYTAQGLQQPVQVPAKTVSFNEIQSRLQGIQ